MKTSGTFKINATHIIFAVILLLCVTTAVIRMVVPINTSNIINQNSSYIISFSTDGQIPDGKFNYFVKESIFYLDESEQILGSVLNNPEYIMDSTGLPIAIIKGDILASGFVDAVDDSFYLNGSTKINIGDKIYVSNADNWSTVLIVLDIKISEW